MAFLPKQHGSIEDYTEDLTQFVNTPLIRQITGGIHVNDALIHGAWEALPQEWTSWWDSLRDHRFAQQDLIDAIDDGDSPLSSQQTETFESRPNSLTEWLQTLNSLSVTRQQRTCATANLPEALRVRMNTKKVAEVSAAIPYIERACLENSITQVVDMGSGQGYLTLALAFLCPALRILAIDGSESQIAGSRAFAASLGITEDKVTHLVRYIDGTASLAKEIEDWAGGDRCMLVGLHACGQLSEHMVRYFAKLPFITSLGAVGCCYNHIRPMSGSCPEGFPISNRLRQRGIALSPTAMMTGCQAPNNWQRVDMSKNESPYARRKFYRAVLEKLLFDKGLQPPPDNRPVWVAGKADLETFTKYATRAMRSLGIPGGKVSVEEMKTYEDRYKHCVGRIAILWTLSVLCCKIVESVIAVDRYWYLTEDGLEEVDIVPIFDYTISPRNLMIAATKSEYDVD